jgi:hypothetical protein
MTFAQTPMKPPRSVHAIDIPDAEDVVPGDTERFVRSLLGDELADQFDRDHPGRIDIYCDAVRLMISTVFTLGAVDGEQGASVHFPEDLMGLVREETGLLLAGLVASGRFVGGDTGGYRLSRQQHLAILAGTERTH